MKYVNLPEDATRRLPFYLAMEEYLARAISCGEDLFFMWQVDPSVIIGRNQVVDNEVNMAYCRECGINVYRRKSGGGCVFANRDNIMFSYVTHNDGVVATTFMRYTSMIAEMLCSLGLEATNTTRNDVLIGDRKVSGNAFYHIPGRSIVHGTMLFDVDMAHMISAITPSRAKLQSKGVESVRSRVTSISEHLDMDIEQFKTYARQYLCDGCITLTVEDVVQIEELSKPYYNPAWIFGRRKKCVKSHRVDGVGEFQVNVVVDSSHRIADIDISGDFMLVADMDSLLINPLRGVEYNPQAVVDAMEGMSAGNVIYGMTNDQLVKLLF